MDIQETQKPTYQLLACSCTANNHDTASSNGHEVTAKPGIVWHGSGQRGLKELQPKVSTHQKNWVYATKEPAVAALFIDHKWSDYDIYIGDWGDGILTLIEHYKGAFDLLKDRQGSLYEVADNHFSVQTSWDTEVVSEEVEKTLHEYKIESAWHVILQGASEGKIKIYDYPHLPEDVTEEDRDDELIELAEKYNAFDAVASRHPHLAERLVVQKQQTPHQYVDQ